MKRLQLNPLTPFNLHPVPLAESVTFWASGPQPVNIIDSVTWSSATAGSLDMNWVIYITALTSFTDAITHISGDKRKLTWYYAMKKTSTGGTGRSIDWSKSSCRVSVAVISAGFLFCIFRLLTSCSYCVFYDGLSHTKLPVRYFLDCSQRSHIFTPL